MTYCQRIKLIRCYDLVMHDLEDFEKRIEQAEAFKYCHDESFQICHLGCQHQIDFKGLYESKKKLIAMKELFKYKINNSKSVPVSAFKLINHYGKIFIEYQKLARNTNSIIRAHNSWTRNFKMLIF